MINKEIKLNEAVASIKADLFGAFRELHTLELLEEAGFNFSGVVAECKSQLIIDIDETVTEFMILKGEIPRIGVQSVIEMYFYILDSKDEDLSDCERQCKQLYLDSKSIIYEQWKSVY